MVRYPSPPSPPSQSWRTFLTNHADCLASIDFFVVPTATFHLLFGFIVLHHERRQIVHFGVTANPTMAWVAQQIREAFPWGTAPRYLIRDRDGAYGQSFRSTVTAMGVEEVVTAPRSPGQNPYVERLIGSAFLAHTSTIITVQGPTCRSARTPRMDDPFSRPGPERLFPCPRSAVCIIVTNALRLDHPRSDLINVSLWRTWTLPASACPCIDSLARSGGISIVMTAPRVDYKIHWLKMMSVPQSRAVVGRHDGINGRDSVSGLAMMQRRRRSWRWRLVSGNRPGLNRDGATGARLEQFSPT